MSLLTEIETMIDDLNHVSFVELLRIPGVDGDYAMSPHPPFNNIVFWLGLSTEAIEALENLRRDGKAQSCKAGAEVGHPRLSRMAR